MEWILRHPEKAILSMFAASLILVTVGRLLSPR